MLDWFIGQSYQTATNSLFPALSGLHDPISDIVARVSFSPSKWLDLNYRTRLDKDTLTTRMIDATAASGTDKFRLTGGYLYTTFDPYYFYDAPLPPPETTPPSSGVYFPRNEVTLAASRSRFTSAWTRLC